MLLFQKRFHEGLKDGSVSLTFRMWTKPMVKAGVRYRSHPVGVLEVTAVSPTTLGAVSDDDARRSGFASAAELAEYLGAMKPVEARTPLWRVELRHAGDDDAKAVAFDDRLTPDEVAALGVKLDRLDRASQDGAWTRATLALIAQHPKRRAGDLAELLGRERLEFKEDVRKLKRLGLTISHEVGYEISPRGKAYLAAAPAKKKAKASRRSARATAPRRARRAR